MWSFSSYVVGNTEILTQVRKYMKGFLWYLCSLTCYGFSIFKQVLILMKRVASQGWQCICFLINRESKLILYSLWVLLIYQASWVQCNSVLWRPQILCGIGWPITMNVNIAGNFSTHVHAPLFYWIHVKMQVQIWNY